MASKESYELLRRIHIADGQLAYGLAVFGNAIAEREGYKEHREMDAVYFYLIHKFGWPPSQVRGMSFEDIRFVLAEEMHGWSLPKDAQFSNETSKPKRSARSK